MPQCEERQENGIRCVLELNHPPFEPPHIHNFGGLGPYTPPLVMKADRPTWDAIWMEQAHTVAKRSLCDRDKVGAIIVTTDNLPLISCYNGPPRGFQHNEQPCTYWCSRASNDSFMWVKDSFESRSFDVKSENGREYWKYPEMPENAWLPLTPKVYIAHGWRRETKLDPAYNDCPSSHAEMNAISRTNFKDREGGTIYVTSDMCFSCAKVVANSGIKYVVIDQTRPKAHRGSSVSYDFLNQCGLVVTLCT